MNILLSIFIFFSIVAAGPPSTDPFYIAPPGFESSAPGTILNHRPIPSPLRGTIALINVAGTFEFLVRSTDSKGNPVAIVTTVVVPYNADPSKIVSHQIAEDSPSLDCAPSWAMQVASPLIQNVMTDAEFLFIQTYLNEGWYVVIPDYEGPVGALIPGKQSGYATLDSLRAAFASNSITGLNSDAKAVFFGYSGGSIPSSWGAALQPKYAPELLPQILGVTLGGWVTNLTGIAEHIDGGLFAGLIKGAIVGLIHEYPELTPVINEEVLSPEALQNLLWVSDQCVVPIFFSSWFQRVFSGPFKLFTKGWGVLDIPLLANILVENTLAYNETDGIPQVPFYVFHSKNDEIAPYKESIRVYNNWCQWGIKSFVYNADVLNGHGTEAITGFEAAFTWIKGLFNGDTPYEGCQFNERVSNAEIDGFTTSLTLEIIALLSSVFFNPLGGAPFSLSGWRDYFAKLANNSYIDLSAQPTSTTNW